ncbi:putative Aspartyl protease family protein [Cocos nucifera]|uniref:Putative Aspartyl protease family protein n=1 Tax=Cocos nucifera TaxID=13894 RepID=A0A8K0HW82_COCNU|nr:putative Aspartyl protease family protein [Cocos nucifera]
MLSMNGSTVLHPNQPSQAPYLPAQPSLPMRASVNTLLPSALVQYGDGSFSTGFFARETLTLTPSNIVTDFWFGCGEGYGGDFGDTAGLFGLGRGKVSLVSQVAEKYGGVFSYCLPTRSSSNGYLTIGAGVQISPNVKFTQMITKSYAPSFYFMELIGMSVGGKDLSIPSTVFTNVGTIIDSGTTITWLPPPAYSALSLEFRQHMSHYSLVTRLGELDTCYDFTGYSRIRVPAIALQFSGGVTLSVDASGILLFASPSQGCLAFASNNKDVFSIVGNMQQRTFDVVYDIAREMIGFGTGGCS